MKPTFKRMFLILVVLILITFLPSCESIDEIERETVTGAYEILGTGWKEETFYNFEELNAYVEGVDALGYSFYYLNVDGMVQDTYPQDVISFYCTEDSVNRDFRITVFAYIYDEIVGYDKEYQDMEILPDGVIPCSYSMGFYAYPFKYEGGEFEYGLFKIEEDMLYQDVLYVYYKGEIVCKLFYLREWGLDIDYFKDLFERKGIIICKEEEK